MFNFCQQCGYHQEYFVGAAKQVKINLNAINTRLEALACRKPYEKQKSSLVVEFDNFLFSLPTPKTIISASPSDITRFLAYKDKGGRTKVHRPACRYFGVTGTSSCNWPKWLVAKTVDNLIGKLCSIFIEAGRSGKWNDLLGMGNPAVHHQLKQYLRLVSKEQAVEQVMQLSKKFSICQGRNSYPEVFCMPEI